MTVCVATICENGLILGASDRMLTAGNIQFTPHSSKIYQLTTSIAAMVSGDMNLHAELIGDLRANIQATLDGFRLTGESRWLTVKEIAGKFSELYLECRARKAEARILIPVGLTRETYLARQGDLSATLTEKLATELLSFALPTASAIFAGVDPSGAHLYVVSAGDVQCHDAVGFSAIGMGAYHANSHLMFAKHSRSIDSSRALALTYAAKKRAEVAPGVGTETDMFIVGHGVGSYKTIERSVVDNLELIYQRAVKSHERTDAKLVKETNAFLEQIAAANAAASSTQSAPTAGDGNAPPSPSAPTEAGGGSADGGTS